MLRRILAVLVLAAGSLVLAEAQPAWACSCGAPGGVASADTAFVGVAESVDRPLLTAGQDVDVRFAVESVQKGDVGSRAGLVTAAQGPSCGYGFTEGRRYQVYLIEGRTDSCLGNTDLGFVRAPGTAKPLVLAWVAAAGAATIVLAALLLRRIRRRRT